MTETHHWVVLPFKFPGPQYSAKRGLSWLHRQDDDCPQVTFSGRFIFGSRSDDSYMPLTKLVETQNWRTASLCLTMPIRCIVIFAFRSGPHFQFHFGWLVCLPSNRCSPWTAALQTNAHGTVDLPSPWSSLGFTSGCSVAWHIFGDAFFPWGMHFFCGAQVADLNKTSTAHLVDHATSLLFHLASRHYFVFRYCSCCTKLSSPVFPRGINVAGNNVSRSISAKDISRPSSCISSL